MLSIRMQRTGRKGHAMFRVVVQESRLSPKSGKVVAQLGSYDPHNKTVTLAKDKAEFYLKNGAQPSDRVARVMESEGIKMPAWFVSATEKKRATRNPEKLRKNQPEEPKVETETAASEAETADETPVETDAEASSTEDNSATDEDTKEEA